MSFASIRDGQIYADGKPLKFVSFNIPNFALQEVPWGRTTLYEQEDLFGSLAQIRTTVARPYTFSFPSSSYDESKHIIITGGYGTLNCTWALNEALFEDFDRGITVAAKYGIRLIIPLIDTYKYWGGIAAFSSMFGISEDMFFSDAFVFQQWISFLNKVLTRNNTISGIEYRSDPTIMGWETINEGKASADWTLSTATALKAIDDKHLVIDGYYGLYGWDESILQSSSIDVVSNHYYPLGFNSYAFSTLDFIAISATAICFLLAASTLFTLKFFPSQIPLSLRITSVALPPSTTSNTSTDSQVAAGKRLSKQNVTVKSCSWVLFTLLLLIFFGLLVYFTLAPVLIRGLDFSTRLKNDCLAVKGKPLIVGEFGLAPFNSLEGLVKTLPSSCASGALIWSLRGHSRFGGFYTHEELGGYWSYHFPGFSSNRGFASDEKQVVDLVIEASKSGSPPSQNNIQIPSSPSFLKSNYTLLNASRSISVSWLGCTGCSNYSLHTTFSNSSSLLIASGIEDNFPSGLFNYNITIADGAYQSLQVEGFGSWGSTGKSTASISILNI